MHCCSIVVSMVTTGAAESEEALEAELLALQGKPPKKGKSPKSSPKSMSMKDIDTMMAGLDGIGDDEVSVCVYIVSNGSITPVW